MPYAYGPSVRKLSKIATLLLAKNYILMLNQRFEELQRYVADISPALPFQLPRQPGPSAFSPLQPRPFLPPSAAPFPAPSSTPFAQNPSSTPFAATPSSTPFAQNPSSAAPFAAPQSLPGPDPLRRLLLPHSPTAPVAWPAPGISSLLPSAPSVPQPSPSSPRWRFLLCPVPSCLRE